MYKKLLLFSFLLFLLSFGFAINSEGSIKLLAVTQDGVGTDANLTINIEPGSGYIWSSVDALVGTSTQNTEKTAVSLLSKLGQDYNKYDYYFAINSEARVVDGPSAGLPTALLLIYMYENKTVPNYVSGTGTISSTGLIGKVGGVLEKTKYAASTGIKLFFIPESELEVVIKENDEVKKVDLSNYAYEKYGIKVVGVKTIDDVLNYNLKDLESIKIETKTVEDKPIYNPPSTTIENNLNDFKNYVSQYIDEVKTNIDLTDNALKNSDINDNDLLNELYSSLTDAKDNFNLGKSAYDKNYLYSSANYLFQSNIILNLITDIVTNPNTLDNVDVLNNDAKQLQIDLNINYTNMPCNNYEWYIASQERYLWAQDRINFVLNTPGNDKASNISRLEAYEYAKEWLKIAKTFITYVKNDNCYLNEKPYANSAKQMLDELRKADPLINKYDLSNDVSKWITGAKDANKNSWTFTTIFESATSLAVINSYLEQKDENTLDIKDKVNTLILDLEKQNKNYVWYSLYLQHAKYLYNEGLFYEQKNEDLDAINSYKTAYRLANFSKNLLDVVDDFEKNKNSLSYISTKDLDVTISKKIADWDIYKTIAFVFMLVIFILIILLIIFYTRLKQNTLSQYVYSIDSKISQIKTLETQLEKDYKNDNISEKNYKSMKLDYKKETDFLVDEKKVIQNKINEITNLESIIKDKHKTLNDLKDKYSKNIISLDEYLKDIKSYDNELKNIKRKIDNDYKEVSASVINRNLESKNKVNYNYNPKKSRK